MNNKEDREYVIQGFGLNRSQVDGEHTFFYDESVNIRKFAIEDSTKYNNQIEQDFVLGGLMVERQTCQELPNVKDVVQSLGMQKTQKEIKCKNIAQGPFLDSIKSKKLGIFLSWIEQSGLWVHFRSCNYFYYGLVDIIDDCRDGNGAGVNAEFREVAKNALWKAFCFSENQGAALLYRFSYPNVGVEQAAEFYRAICEFYHNADYLDAKEIACLDKFCASADGEKCVFLANNTPLQIQERFTEFYLEPLMLFCNSTHWLDEEVYVKQDFEKFSVASPDFQSIRHEFLKSESNLSVQMSDVMVGIIGKLFQYTNKICSIEQLDSDLKGMTIEQHRNFRLLASLILRSMDEFPALVNRVQADSMKESFECCLRYVQNQKEPA